MFDILSQKKCGKCGETKSLDQFYRYKDNKVMGACKNCTKADRKARYLQEPEKYRKLTRLYNEKNPDRNRARAISWYREHPDKVKQRVKKWKKNNPDKIREGERRYYASNPEKVTEHNHRRLSRKKNNGGCFTASEWKFLKSFYKNSCLACKRKEPEIKLEADHVIPLVMGGVSSIDNIQPLCRSCNASKGARAIDYR